VNIQHICTCVHAHARARPHPLAHTRTRTRTHMHRARTRRHMRVHIRAYVCTYACVHMCGCACASACVRACVCVRVRECTPSRHSRKKMTLTENIFSGGGLDMHVEGFNMYAPMTTLIYCPIVGITAAVRFQNKPISQNCSDCDDFENSLTTPKLVGNTNHLGFETAASR
jgi:hypothetical protein